MTSLKKCPFVLYKISLSNCPGEADALRSRQLGVINLFIYLSKEQIWMFFFYINDMTWNFSSLASEDYLFMPHLKLWSSYSIILTFSISL